MLACTVALLVVLMAQVLAGPPVEVHTGAWPLGVGIVLHADVLGVTFALLSVLVLVAATAHEVLAGVQERVFPGLVVLLSAGLTGVFLTGDLFDFYVFFELAMTAAYILATYGGTRRELGSALVFTTVNLLGTFVFLLSVAGLYHVTGTLDMGLIAARVAGVDPNATILIAVGFFASWSVLSNAFCSVILLVYQPFTVGHTIELSDAEVKGKVVNFNLLYTTLEAADGELIHVPNNLFFQQPIRKLAGGGGASLDQQLLEKPEEKGESNARN